MAASFNIGRHLIKKEYVSLYNRLLKGIVQRILRWVNTKIK
jgi:hypothetical protein